MRLHDSRLTVFEAQRGATLLLMIVIMVVGIAAVLVTSLGTSALNNARQERTSEVLAQAKAALIGYATTYGDTHPGEVHGYLPCPEVDAGNPEGSANGVCAAKDVNQIGRLPWRTLGLTPLRDGHGECLWYAVSGNYKYNPKTGLMNWDTNGQLQVFATDGTTRLDSNADQVVAVIFAPGATLSGQDRSGGSAPVCGGNYTVANYLDNDIAHSINNAVAGIGQFRQGIPGTDVNDQVVYITRGELWVAIEKRTDFYATLNLMTQRVAECLADYGRNNANHNNKSMPWPAPLDVLDFTINTKFDDQSSEYAGRVPYRVDTSKVDTNNDMTGNNLMANNGLVCPYFSSTPSVELEFLYPWWENWKDHLYYAISREFRPKTSDTSSCGQCVEVSGNEFAGVVMFAGKKLTGQTRLNKAAVVDYLDSPNANTFSGGLATGVETYANAGGATFNDILYCIRTNLNVTPCP